MTRSMGGKRGKKKGTYPTRRVLIQRKKARHEELLTLLFFRGRKKRKMTFWGGKEKGKSLPSRGKKREDDPNPDRKRGPISTNKHHKGVEGKGSLLLLSGKWEKVTPLPLHRKKKKIQRIHLKKEKKALPFREGKKEKKKAGEDQLSGSSGRRNFLSPRPTGG